MTRWTTTATLMFTITFFLSTLPNFHSVKYTIYYEIITKIAMIICWFKNNIISSLQSYYGMSNLNVYAYDCVHEPDDTGAVFLSQAYIIF